MSDQWGYTFTFHFQVASVLLLWYRVRSFIVYIGIGTYQRATSYEGHRVLSRRAISMPHMAVWESRRYRWILFHWNKRAICTGSSVIVGTYMHRGLIINFCGLDAKLCRMRQPCSITEAEWRTHNLDISDAHCLDEHENTSHSGSKSSLSSHLRHVNILLSCQNEKVIFESIRASDVHK